MEGSTHITLDETTAFVLGNGPSLGQIDLPRLSPYATIGLNAAYRHWRAINWRPRYYACLDEVVGLSHARGIAGLIEESQHGEGIQAFLLRQNLIGALGVAADDPRVINFDALRVGSDLLRVDPITTGSHATLWAAALGYRQIVVLGVDGRYKEIVPGAERRGGHVLEITQTAENPNYFFSGYQQPGDRYHVPNAQPRLHLNAWRGVAEALDRAGIVAANGSPNSAVDALPLVDAQVLLGKRRAPLRELPPAPRTRHDDRVQQYARIIAGAPLRTAAAILGPLAAALAILGAAVLGSIEAALILGLIVGMSASCAVGLIALVAGPELVRRLLAVEAVQKENRVLVEETARQLRIAAQRAR